MPHISVRHWGLLHHFLSAIYCTSSCHHCLKSFCTSVIAEPLPVSCSALLRTIDYKTSPYASNIIAQRSLVCFPNCHWNLLRTLHIISALPSFCLIRIFWDTDYVFGPVRGTGGQQWTVKAQVPPSGSFITAKPREPRHVWAKNKCLLLWANEFGVVFNAALVWQKLIGADSSPRFVVCSLLHCWISNGLLYVGQGYKLMVICQCS